jgi:hypothetical protein
MPEFLRTAFSSPAASPLDVFLRLVAAVILGGGVAWIYRASRDPNDAGPTFPATLVLLSVLIAASTQVIGDNIARAFSLVGALSIVRFRTVVRDTQDTAFVIFAVVTGMAVGAGDLKVAGIGFGVVSIAALVMKPRAVKSPVSGAAFLVTLRVGLGHDIEVIAGSLLDAHRHDHGKTGSGGGSHVQGRPETERQRRAARENAQSHRRHSECGTHTATST